MDPLAAALGRIPSGLFVLTAHASSGPVGMLASWLMQAAFEPPMITVALGQGRPLLESAEGGSPVGVNILSTDAKRLIARFGRPETDGYDPFKNLELLSAVERAPILADSLAWLVGMQEAVVAAGDHRIVVLRIEQGGVNQAGDPNVHLRKNGLRY